MTLRLMTDRSFRMPDAGTSLVQVNDESTARFGKHTLEIWIFLGEIRMKHRYLTRCINISQ
jgi:hypothetical protein